MKNKKILDFVSCMEVNVKNIKSFMRLVLENEQKYCNLPYECGFKVKPLVNNVNGYVYTIKLNENTKTIIVINSRVALRTKKTNSNLVAWFYLYATIVHELEHLVLIRQLKNGEIEEFQRFNAALSQYNRYSLTHEENVFRRVVTVPNYTKVKKQTISHPELICTLTGFSHAYEVFEELLGEKEKKIFGDIKDSLSFLCTYMEITYGPSNQPRYEFAQNIARIQRKAKKNIKLLGQLRQLKYVLDSSGEMISPMEIYKKSINDKSKFYDAWLINLFMMYNLGWEQLFDEGEAFREHMEKLANEYCMKTVFFIKNMDIGEIFLNADVLQDNAAMMIRNTKILNILMKRFGMKHTGGSVIPLYK